MSRQLMQGVIFTCKSSGMENKKVVRRVTGQPTLRWITRITKIEVKHANVQKNSNQCTCNEISKRDTCKQDKTEIGVNGAASQRESHAQPLHSMSNEIMPKQARRLKKSRPTVPTRCPTKSRHALPTWITITRFVNCTESSDLLIII